MSEQVIEVAPSTEVEEPATARSATPSVPACACSPAAAAGPAEVTAAIAAPLSFGSGWACRCGCAWSSGSAYGRSSTTSGCPSRCGCSTASCSLPDTRWASSLEFFVYDSVKVLLLLTLVVFGVGVVRSFFSPERTRALLHGRREATGNVLAASLGIVTPFCSCSAVPLFIGFVEAGIPLGVTFSFLIAAPMVNEIALVLLYGLFGWEVAALYLVTGLLIAMVAGWVIGRLKMERYIQDWVLEIRMGEAAAASEDLSWAGAHELRLAGGQGHRRQGLALRPRRHRRRRPHPRLRAARTSWRPSWAPAPGGACRSPSCSASPCTRTPPASSPSSQALLEKGAALGTVLAFMMSVIALSLPETIILKKVLKWQLIAVFLGVVGVGIMFVGFFFNLVLG